MGADELFEALKKSGYPPEVIERIINWYIKEK